MSPPVIITTIKPGMRCFCGDLIKQEWAQYDTDLRCHICFPCSNRIVILTSWLSVARIRKCIQPEKQPNRLS